MKPHATSTHAQRGEDASGRPLRVVLLSKALVVGAYQRKAELLAARPELELTVVVPPLWKDGGRVQRLERVHTAGYALVETPIFRPGDFHLHFYPRFGEVLARIRPDLVHVDEEPYNLATFLALRAARRVGARSLFFTWQNLDRPTPPPFGWFERRAYAWVDGAIAGSPAAAARLRARGYRGALWTIPQFGVDPATFHPPEVAPSPSGSLRVGYAGRLVRAKGVDLLVEALAGLPGGWRLTIAGEGPERATLEAQAAALGVADRVSFLPWLAAEALADFYRDLDVLVLPSRSMPRWTEQFGRVLVEAMACGVACVGAASGEIPWVLGDAGRLFPEGDAAALRDVLAGLAADPAARARLAAAGRARAFAHFTMAHVAAETVAAYRELCRRASGPPAR